MDLFDTSHTLSISSNYYELVIIDDYSRFIWTLFIVTKDHAFTTFKQLAKVFQNENNYNIFAIKSDHGGEFQNYRFERYCNKHGIKHNFLLQELLSKMEL